MLFPGRALAALAFAAGALSLGYLVAEALVGRRVRDRAARWGLALPGFALVALAVMAAHMATGGRVLSSPWLLRGAVLALAAGLVARKLRARQPAPPGWWRELVPPFAMVAIGLLVWGSPVGRMLPIDHTGDTNLHTGWVAQLLAGESTPSGAITGQIPNFYPWMFHAVLALVARFTPGGTAFHALGGLQLLLVAGSMLSLYALGRALLDRWQTGAAAALFAGAAGGVGFVLLRRPDVILEPRAMDGEAGVRYLGDLLFKRSYNSSFANLSPPFPRDLALALLAGSLLLLVLGLRARSRPMLVASGVVLGMAGLAGGEAFFVGAGVVVLLALMPGQADRWRTAAAVLVPALGVWALWVVPLVASWMHLGFVSITRVGPVNLPPLAVLVSWGIVTPFAVWGAIKWLPRLREDPGPRVALAVVLVAAGILVASALVPGVLGRAFDSLGRRHRYWPLLHLGTALFGAAGAAMLHERLHARRRWMAGALATAVVLVAVASPLAASLALPRKLGRPGLLVDALDGRPGSALGALAPRPGMRCVAAVQLDKSVRVWSYTGYRLVMYDWYGGEAANRPRLRWKRIYEEIGTETVRIRDNDLLTNVTADEATWREVAAAYGVDLVLVPREAAARLPGLPATDAVLGTEPVAVIHAGDCNGDYPPPSP